MKKFLIVLISVLICFPSVAFASEDYINLADYPYSTHVLGEDLVIYGETSFSHVTIGLFYPKENGYDGSSKYVVTISRDELKNGHVIKTGTFSRLWPEGNWTIKLQNGTVSDTLTVPMSADAQFDRTVKIATYSSDTLESLSTYSSRGGFIKDNVITFQLENDTIMKVFSWNNFEPVNNGESRVFIAFYKNGYLTDIQSFSGKLSVYSDYVAIEDDTAKLKIFCWNESLIPQIKAIG